LSCFCYVLTAVLNTCYEFIKLLPFPFKRVFLDFSLYFLRISRQFFSRNVQRYLCFDVCNLYLFSLQFLANIWQENWHNTTGRRLEHVVSMVAIKCFWFLFVARFLSFPYTSRTSFIIFQALWTLLSSEFCLILLNILSVRSKMPNYFGRVQFYAFLFDPFLQCFSIAAPLPPPPPPLAKN
jgi:hypothetical protein